MPQIKMNQVLPTFPSLADIQDIKKAQRSGKYYVLITRLAGAELEILSILRYKYYSPENGDFVQKIFPFKEGVTFADLLNVKKEIGEPPMMITRAAKVRMSREQLIAAFIPDPTKRSPTAHGEYSIYCFILAIDVKAWRWIDNLKMALGSYTS
jgi:hypothetical protein